MLLAEDLLLLLTDDVSGKPWADPTRLDCVLAGAVLFELAALGRVDVAAPGEPVPAGRLVVRDPAPTGDTVLDEALRRIAGAGPAQPESVIPTVATGLREVLLARLADHGILRSEEGRIFGVIPTRRWPVADSSHEREVLAELGDVLVAGHDPAPRVAALIALLHVVDQVPRVIRGCGLPARDLRRRAASVGAGGLAEVAVRRAVEAVEASVAAVTAATAAGAAT